VREHRKGIERALLEALDRIAIAVGNRSTAITLRRTENGLEVHGENSDAGSMTAAIDATGWKDGELNGVNLSYLHNAVRFVASDDVAIGITDEDHPLILKHGPFFAAVMPVRIEKGVAA
jgi:DNA polymerase III sliding clamp (beta) subunit (PCNA family)